ncbi:hypothetical protein PV327_010323 [Microctonus hyperodae]|uniref:Small integral membrane protein 14 n=1 Tax=Microctonus hyperodae TaxID=165561 RepID=A0AA39KUT7_MICHY|nr:hypothetical protein PV327_010323 [Microctonus hyperodae]
MHYFQLRQTQAYCTDNECLSLMRLPGPESSESIPDYLFIGLAFVAMAILYLFRPNSLRQGSGGNDVKIPRNNSIGPNDDPPPPPPSFN